MKSTSQLEKKLKARTILYQIETFSPSFKELVLGEKTYEGVVKTVASYLRSLG